jgi:hypothetical protein
MGHRRFVESNHTWRKNKSSFENPRETRQAPKPLSEDEVIEQYENFEQTTFGKITRKRKRNNKIRWHNW